MKKIFLYTFVFWANILFAQYTEWHVSVSGTSTGLGTEISPWDLQTALNKPNTVVKPGDVIWLHGGTYTGRFTSPLNGTLANFITVSSYPGEWAVINGNINPFVPEVYSPVNPCAIGNQLQAEPLPESTYEMTANDLEDLSFYSESRILAQTSILKVTGSYVIYKNFEVTCLGNINRVLDNCNLNNGFQGLTGIDNSPTNTSNTTCKFVNLVVRNIAGSGIASWKYAEDSEIYGCLIYNNGYILRNDDNCASSSNTFSVFGKGPGIYTQNASNLTRKIKNNFIMNNYDSGMLVWSATTNPTFDYVKNYDLKDNIFLNNGNPGRRHLNIDANTGSDSKPNLVIDSYSTNSFCHPTNINVQDNIFYINNRASWISGVRVGNSNNVSINNNYFFKATTFGSFLGNNINLSVKNNFYLGKRIQVYTQPSTFGTNNWDFNSNTWYSRDNEGQIPSYPKCYQDNSSPAVRRTLAEFSLAYPPESDQLSSSFRAASVTAFGKLCLRTYNNSVNSPVFANLNKIVQNVYDSNKFYVTLNNPTLVSNRTVLFSSYSIPNGKFYTIRDPQNYFTVLATGNYDAINGINFPLNLTAFEQPIGFYDHCTEHTYAEISTFIVEFGCSNIPYDLFVQNYSEPSGFKIYEAINNITFGPNYVATLTSDIIANSSKQIVLKPNTHIKPGRGFLAKIVNPCPNIDYVGEGTSNRIASSVSYEKNEENDENEKNIVIYPNPNLGIFKILLNESQDGTLQITDLVGFTVYTSKFRDQKEIEVNLQDKPKGIYIVKVLSGDQTFTEKIIKN